MIDKLNSHPGDTVSMTKKVKGLASTNALTPSVRQLFITSSSLFTYTLLEVTSPVNHDTVEVRSSWTRGLAVHPVAAAVSFVALLLSLSTHLTVTLLASLMSFLAALITLIAFAIDIALLALVRHEMDNLDDRARTITGPGMLT
jgi:hypothetical protein